MRSVASTARGGAVLATLSAFFLAFASPAAAAKSTGKLTISPAPNTPDVSPETQISVLGPKPSQIRSVKVTGAESGPHSGSLQPYSGKRGASFVLDQPLAEGESVEATVRVKGLKTKRFSFTVADLAPLGKPLNLKATQPDKLDHFVSEPELIPPQITVNQHVPARLRRRRHPAHPASLAGRPPRVRQLDHDQAGRPGRADDRRRARRAGLVSPARRRPTSPPTCACRSTAASRS